jgi:hypothetical protein
MAAPFAWAQPSPRVPAVAGPAAPEQAEALPLIEWAPVDEQQIAAQLGALDGNAETAAADAAVTAWQQMTSERPRVQAYLLAASHSVPALGDWLTRLETALSLDDVEQFSLSLTSSEFDPLVAANLKLWAAIRFVQHEYYDESLALLSTIDAKQVVDPAAFLFYRGVAEHQLVQLAEAKASLLSLTQPDYPLPARFRQLAEMMLLDLERVEPDSLGAIARQMSDVRRRLSLGVADKQVQDLEDKISDQLDKMIEKIEQQIQQQQQQQQQAGGPPSTPMDDSRIAGGGGDGDVDIKDIGSGSGWGDLPPKERERIMQQIGRDFPSYYRDVIEEYFRRLATEERDQKP